MAVKDREVSGRILTQGKNLGEMTEMELRNVLPGQIAELREYLQEKVDGENGLVKKGMNFLLAVETAVKEGSVDPHLALDWIDGIMPLFTNHILQRYTIA